MMPAVRFGLTKGWLIFGRTLLYRIPWQNINTSPRKRSDIPARTLQ